MDLRKFQDLENQRVYGGHAFVHTPDEFRHKNMESEKSHHEVLYDFNCVIVYFLISLY